MLSKEQNEALYKAGPGTPMGELLRRYWTPIGAAAELDHNPIKPIRLMNEELVLYKDEAGHYGLVDRHCPHRRADMSYAWVEGCGIRCNYHGWKFDESGACVHQPFEEIAHPDARFKDRVTIKAYPVEEKAGLLWAYLGPPDKKPLVPNYEPFTRTDAFVQIIVSEVPCNWFQCHENTIDPVHFEWLHDHWSRRLFDLRDGPDPATHLRLNFVEFEHGFQYQRIRQGQSDDDELWTVGRVSLWPHGFYLGGHFEWRVPVDDGNCLSILWVIDHVPHEKRPFRQDKIPYWYAPLTDERTGRWITSHTVNQDFVGWVGQGAVADRTQEHLGESDRGIILLRRRMLEEARKVERGEDPKAIVRDPIQNQCIPLPTVGLDVLRDGRPLAETIEGYRRRRRPGQGLGEFPYFAHQPPEIRAAFLDAMGLVEAAVEDERRPAGTGMVGSGYRTG
jgi:5,5'-dehydrodivanillate O-demethylase oxygenase subunit